MSWAHQQESAHYGENCVVPYSYTSFGSFMDFFEGLTYDHVNFIFCGGSHLQGYPPVSMGYYKYGYGEPTVAQYYYDGHSYWANDPLEPILEYRMPSEHHATTTNDQTAAAIQQPQGAPNASPSNHNNPGDYQVVWQDNIDPDNMTYEELLELGETVGTQSKGLSQDMISRLPVSKFRRYFFLRKKSRVERCVICQMEYRRGERIITLPCKHKYHVDCGSKWLGINKACPICYAEVCFDTATKK